MRFFLLSFMLAIWLINLLNTCSGSEAMDKILDKHIKQLSKKILRLTNGFENLQNKTEAQAEYLQYIQPLVALRKQLIIGSENRNRVEFLRKLHTTLHTFYGFKFQRFKLNKLIERAILDIDRTIAETNVEDEDLEEYLKQKRHLMNAKKNKNNKGRKQTLKEVADSEN